MKQNMPIAITAVVVIVGLAGAALTARLFESSDVTTQREIETLLEQAQQRLNSFDPGGARTKMTLDATAPATDQWSEAVQTMNNGPLGQALGNQERLLQQVSAEYEHLVDPSQRRGATSADKALGEMQTGLQNNEKLIAEAVKLASDAVGLDREHAEATRLRAMLLHTQADLLRRQAALYREAAQNQRIRFMREHDDWQRTNAQLEGVEVELTGRGQVAPAAVTKREKAAEPAATSASKATGRPGFLTRALRKALGREGEAAEEDEAESAEPEAVAVDEPEAEEEQAEAIPDAPPIQDRIAGLEKQRTDVRQAIGDTEKEVARLQGIVADLEARLATASERSMAAHKKMLELEQKGTDASDPSSLPGFVEAYEAASAEYREASMEASTLKDGAIRNTRIDTDDENELITAPLAPVEPGQEMAAEHGLDAMQKELDIAKRLLEKRSDLAKELDLQLKGLATRKAEVQQHVDNLQRQRDKEAVAALKELRSAVASLIDADALETKALDLLETQGTTAVQQATRAGQSRIREARTLNVDGLDKRLNMISRDAFATSHASLIAGDMHFVTAAIHAQRAEDLARHAKLLTSIENMNINAKRDLLPEGTPADGVPEAVWQATAAEADAQDAYDKAIAAGEEAINVYKEIAQELNDIWVIHANIAAVSYMLAEFVEDPTTAQVYREQAAQEYERSIRDRVDSPEAKIYQPIMQKLTQAPQ